MRRSCVAAPFTLLLLTFSASAQLPMLGFSGGGGGSRDGTFQGNATFRLPLPRFTVLVNAPYSGEQSEESTQTLADGTHITRTMGLHQKAWRDSQGRVRVERPFLSGGPQPSSLKGVPTLVEIFDPVAGYTYIMDDVTRVVHRIKMEAVPQTARSVSGPVVSAMQSRVASVPGPPAAGGVPRPAAGATGGSAAAPPVLTIQPSAVRAPTPAAVPRLQSSHEDLGTEMIDGVLAQGTRTTTVTPVGAMGNDAPMTATHDMWFSPELQLYILTTTTDPRSGVSTSKIANLSRSEPDPALFFVPADYRIVDETESFTIKWGEN